MWKESIRSKENHPGGPPFIHRPSVTYLNLQFLIDFSFSLLRLSCLHLSLSSTHTYVLPSSCSLSSPLRLLALVIHIYFVLSCPRSLNIFGVFLQFRDQKTLFNRIYLISSARPRKMFILATFPPRVWLYSVPRRHQCIRAQDLYTEVCRAITSILILTCLTVQTLYTDFDLHFLFVYCRPVPSLPVVTCCLLFLGCLRLLTFCLSPSV